MSDFCNRWEWEQAIQKSFVVNQSYRVPLVPEWVVIPALISLIPITALAFVAVLVILLTGCSLADQENLAIARANRDHAVVCMFGGGVC